MRDSLTATVKVLVNDENKIGIGGVSPIYEVKTDKFSFLKAIPSGAVLGVETLKGYVAQMRFVFSSKGCKI
jgi:hypothetical protein